MHKGINTTVDEGQTPVIAFDQDVATAYMPARTFAPDGGIDERFAERDIADALHTSSGSATRLADSRPHVRRRLPVHGDNSVAMRGERQRTGRFSVDVARSLDTTGGYATNQGQRGTAGHRSGVQGVALYRGKDGVRRESSHRSRPTRQGRSRPVVLAFNCKQTDAAVGEVSPTLRSMHHADSHANGGGQVAVMVWTSDNVNADPIRTYTNEGTTFRLHNCVQHEAAPVAFEPRYYTRDNKTVALPATSPLSRPTHRRLATVRRMSPPVSGASPDAARVRTTARFPDGHRPYLATVGTQMLSAKRCSPTTGRQSKTSATNKSNAWQLTGLDTRPWAIRGLCPAFDGSAPHRCVEALTRHEHDAQNDERNNSGSPDRP
jgi:hypothetical protein